ncbi:MAG: MATE family efflux transporter [Gemmatimonadaceae bacterium]
MPAVQPRTPRTTAALRMPTRQEIADVARLAGPIVVVQVGLMLMGVVDTAMVGHVDATALAGVALGNLYWLLVVMLGMGTLMALDPVVAQAAGAKDDVAIARGLQRGLLLSVAISVLSSIALLPGEALFGLLRQPVEVQPIAVSYAHVNAWGTLPFFVFIVLRQTLQAFSRIRPIVWAVIIGNVANTILDWLLVFGKFGAPQMGAIGSAYASLISRWIMCLALAWLGAGILRPYLQELRRDTFDTGALYRLLVLGVPIGVHQWIEVTAFSAGLVLVGWMGTTAVAGHQIAITLAALTYMVPLGVSAAAAVLVGHAIGREDPEGARREAGAAIVCGAGFMSTTAIVLLTCAGFLSRSFTSDPSVIAVAITLIPIAGVFQVFDGIQGVSSGILRGSGDTHVPAILNFLGYSVGLSLGAWLAFTQEMGPRGVWWGLVAGLAAVALALGWRVHHRLGGELQRIVIDRPVHTAN